MRCRSLLALLVLGSLFVVGCGDNGDLDSHGAAVHTSEVLPPPQLPRLKSIALPYVAHQSGRLSANPAAALRLRNIGPNTDGAQKHPIETVSGARTILQKTLLVTATGDEPSYLAAKDALDRIGVPYQALIATQQPLTANMLTDDVSTCYFNSVIFSTSGLGYVDATGTWTSALSADQWQMVADFEAACSAREAIWYAWPSPDIGLDWASTFTDADQVTALVAQPSFFAGVRADAQIPVRYAYGYTATLDNTATTTALLQDNFGGVMAALHTYPDGRQVVSQTFDQSPYLVHSLVVEYDLIRWVTGNMFLGKKRAYLSAQVDDMFIDDDMWVAGVGNDASVQYRLTGADIVDLVTWQTAFRATLPTGSSFTTVLPFNGVGTLKTEYADRTLLNQAKLYNKSFLWMSHTWDHENMDAMTRFAAASEVNKNINVAHDYHLNGFNQTELVTPDVSGLGNYNALEGMWNAGVRNVVSNTSITAALNPSNPGTNPSFNVGRANPLEPRIYQVPRHPTNVFYDVQQPANQADEYNHIYAAFYGRTLSYAEVIDADSTFGAFYLLQGDIDPLMFHQPNLGNYNAGTGQPPASIYGDWIASASGKFLALIPAPIQTLQQRDIAAAMKARGAYNACGVTASIVESGTGGRSLHLATTQACTVPVTGLFAPMSGSVENYLGSPTTSINLGAHASVSIPLP